jgi:hypothetical protein
MTNKFKIGDMVEIVDECKDTWFYHRQPMKIIGFNEWYYFTDYWKLSEPIGEFSNDGITEECLQYSHRRNEKLERIL